MPLRIHYWPALCVHRCDFIVIFICFLIELGPCFLVRAFYLYALINKFCLYYYFLLLCILMTESVKIDKSLLDKVRKLKKATGITITAFINLAIKEHLNKRQKHD